MATTSDSLVQRRQAAELRRESGLRTVFAVLLTSTVASFYVATSFPWQLGAAFPLGTPIDHILAAAILLVVATVATWGALQAAFIWRTGRAGLEPIRLPFIRRRVYELGRQIGIRPVTLASGGPTDTKFSALMLGGHYVVRIGRGALSSAKKNPDAFDFRVAHELVHLASRDPQRDHLLQAVYIVTVASLALAIAVSYSYILQSALAAQVTDGGMRVGRLRILIFPTVANGVAFLAVLLVLLLESRSARRLREFHADALASALVGDSGAQAFDAAAEELHRPRARLRRLFDKHPERGERAQITRNAAAALRFDRVLFFVQGYFGAFILETLLQALLSKADPWSSSPADRAASVVGFFRQSSIATTATVGFLVALLIAANVVVIARFQATIASLHDLSIRQRLRMVLSAVLLTILGSLTCVGSSVATFWNLNVLDWNLVAYVRAFADRHLVHLAHTATLVVVYALVIWSAARRVERPDRLSLLGYAPAFMVLLVGYAFYGKSG